MKHSRDELSKCLNDKQMYSVIAFLKSPIIIFIIANSVLPHVHFKANCYASRGQNPIKDWRVNAHGD